MSSPGAGRSTRDAIKGPGRLHASTASLSPINREASSGNRNREYGNKLIASKHATIGSVSPANFSKVSPHPSALVAVMRRPIDLTWPKTTSMNPLCANESVRPYNPPSGQHRLKPTAICERVRTIKFVTSSTPLRIAHRCCPLRDPPGRAECQAKGTGHGKRYFVDITSNTLVLRKLDKT